MEISTNAITSFILGKVAKLTKTDRETLHGDTLLADVGVDSLFAVLICGFIEDEYDLEVEPILMFEYKTANQVAQALLNMIEEK
jgi:acyl carrier protein